jgi:activating signal cointegrator complex subunit 1
MDNEDRSNAAQILTEVQEIIIKPIVEEFGAIEMRVEGLEYMNDDPKAVDVIYGKIESEALQLLADDIVNYFVEKGLAQKQYDRVKMHVTLLNSLFRDKSSDDQQKRATFDADGLLKKYGSFYFGTMALKEIHLSQRYSTGSNGFYEATAVIKT